MFYIHDHHQQKKQWHRRMYIIPVNWILLDYFFQLILSTVIVI